MANIGGKKIVGELRTSAEQDRDEANRRSAVFALSRLPGEEATTELIQMAKTSTDPQVRKQAVFWLASQVIQELRILGAGPGIIQSITFLRKALLAVGLRKNAMCSPCWKSSSAREGEALVRWSGEISEADPNSATPHEISRRPFQNNMSLVARPNHFGTVIPDTVSPPAATRQPEFSKGLSAWSSSITV